MGVGLHLGGINLACNILGLCLLANTTGTSKYWATIHAIPIPEASMVRILVTSTSANLRLNSFPISPKA